MRSVNEGSHDLTELIRTQAELFKAPTNASTAEEVARPNVAAIAAAQAVRNAASEPTSPNIDKIDSRLSTEGRH
jgi:hypothetical protein